MRTGLKQVKRHGDAALAASGTVEKEQQWMQALIKVYGYKLCDIFNADETGLLYV